MKHKLITKSNIMNLAGVALVIYLTVLLAQTIKRNSDLQKQISTLQTQTMQLQDQTDELRYKVQYYQTDSFKEKEARAKLGLQLPGESVVILPPVNTAATTVVVAQAKPKIKASNPQQWLNFLLGRST